MRKLLPLVVLAAPAVFAQCQPLGFGPPGMAPITVLDQPGDYLDVVRQGNTATLGFLWQPASGPMASRVINGVGTASLNSFLNSVCGATYANRYYPASSSAPAATVFSAQTKFLFALADFNGDGIVDSAAAVDTVLNVTLLRADGTVAAVRPMPSLRPVVTLATGDFNGDGRVDLATISGTTDALTPSTTLTIFTNKGDATFQESVQTSSGVAFRMGVGDLDGDGRDDIAYNDRAPFAAPLPPMHVLLSTAAGGFTELTRIPMANGLGGILIADMNGDGKRDIVFSSGVLYVAINQGANFPVFAAGTETAPFDFAIADVTNDGKLDAIGVGNLLNMYLGGDGGKLNQPQTYSSVASPPSVAIVRLGDGRSVLLISGNPRVYVVPVTSTGALPFFQGRSEVGGSDLGLRAAADLNRDGKIDAINVQGQVLSYLNDGGPFGATATQAANFPGLSGFTGGIYGNAISVGDVNGDGNPDAALSIFTTSNAQAALRQIALFNGNGSGGFGAGQRLADALQPQDVLIAPLGKSTLPDIVASDGTASVLRLRNAGGTFSIDRLPAAPGQQPVVALTTGDFDGDGNIDVAYAANPFPTGGGQAGYAGVVLVNVPANNGYQLGPAIPVGSPAGQPIRLTSGDFNGDHKLDLAVLLQANPTVTGARQRTQIQILLGNGQGGFQPGQTVQLLLMIFPAADNRSANAASFRTADLNGDGFLDILYAEGYVLGKGDGTFHNQIVVPGALGAIWADINGDSKLDIWALRSAPSPSLLTTLLFNTFAELPSGTEPSISSVNVAGGGNSIAPNTWIEIKGTNLAPSSTSAGLVWSAAPEFAQGKMPTVLGGASAKVNNKAAYMYYASPTQINVLTTLDPATGPVQITVNNGLATSAAFTVTQGAVAPSFLLLGATKHIAATHANFSLLGPASMSVPGYTFTPARPNETVTLYATGFGLPSTALTEGSSTQSSTLTPLPVFQIGGVTASVAFGGVVAPGLYQFNVTIPGAATNGDNSVTASYRGAQTPAGAVIAVQR